MKRDRAAVRAGFKDEIRRSTGQEKGRKQREEASVLRYKIAVVTTEYMQTHIKACLAKLDLDCDFSIYLYDPSDDLYEIYRSIPDGVAGIMTSGNRCARRSRRTRRGTTGSLFPWHWTTPRSTGCFGTFSVKAASCWSPDGSTVTSWSGCISRWKNFWRRIMAAL